MLYNLCALKFSACYMENKMLKLWKVWYARRQLALAIREEEQARRYAEHLRTVTIPVLEGNLERAELNALCANFLKGSK